MIWVVAGTPPTPLDFGSFSPPENVGLTGRRFLCRPLPPTPETLAPGLLGTAALVPGAGSIRGRHAIEWSCLRSTPMRL
jgi:hypothetical protein